MARFTNSWLLQVATWDCHFCFYFRTPFGVTSVLLPATLLLWLRYPGFILAMALFNLGLRVGNGKHSASTDFCFHGLRARTVASTGVRDVLGLSLGDGRICCYRLVGAGVDVALHSQT